MQSEVIELIKCWEKQIARYGLAVVAHSCFYSHYGYPPLQEWRENKTWRAIEYRKKSNRISKERKTLKLIEEALIKALGDDLDAWHAYYLIRKDYLETKLSGDRRKDIHLLFVKLGILEEWPNTGYHYIPVVRNESRQYYPKMQFPFLPQVR